MQPITAAELRLKPENYKNQCIELSIQNIYHEVLQTAVYKTSYFKEFRQDGTKYGFDPIHRRYNVSPDDIVNALKEKFIDCKVEYTTVWVEVSPGHKHEKTGILIDWS